MPSITLSDLLPQEGKVPIRQDRDIIVYGIGTKYISKVLDRFSELRKAFVEQAQSMNMIEVAGFTPKLLAAICAQGLVPPAHSEEDDKKRDADVERLEGEVGQFLVLGEQIEVAIKIFELTFPKGTGPFKGVLRELGLLDSGGGAAAPASASAAIGREQDTSSESSLTT